jgi:hypothetical protein
LKLLANLRGRCGLITEDRRSGRNGARRCIDREDLGGVISVLLAVYVSQSAVRHHRHHCAMLRRATTCARNAARSRNPALRSPASTRLAVTAKFELGEGEADVERSLPISDSRSYSSPVDGLTGSNRAIADWRKFASCDQRQKALSTQPPLVDLTKTKRLTSRPHKPAAEPANL